MTTYRKTATVEAKLFELGDEDGNLGYPFVMEHREFYKEFTEI